MDKPTDWRTEAAKLAFRDRAFIDAVQQADANALAEERYPAANMVAVLRHRGRVVRPVHVPISPQRHVVLVEQQLRRIQEAARPGRIPTG